jgi:hypothetical protein
MTLKEADLLFISRDIQEFSKLSLEGANESLSKHYSKLVNAIDIGTVSDI